MNLKSLKNPFITHRTSPSKSPPGPRECVGSSSPDLVYAFTGWRVWRISIPLPGSSFRPTLRSVVLDSVWTPRLKMSAEHNFDLRAKCRGVVDARCTCGIYGFNEMAEALNYLIGIRRRWLGAASDVAMGTVSLWGRVVECERGYRAQYAYPRHIYLPATASRHMSTISEMFGVSVGIHASVSDEHINVTPSTQPDHRWPKTLRLHRSGVLHAQNTLYEVGLYDGESTTPTAYLR